MPAPVVLQGQNTVGMTATVSALLTRPNDTTQYAAGDIVGDLTTVASMIRFPNIARFRGGGGIIQSAVMTDSVAAATKPDLELYLFNSAITMQADNAAWNPSDADSLLCIGVIAFPTGAFKTMGANGATFSTGLGLAFNCAPSSQLLLGVLVTRNAYTPTALEQFQIQLQVLQD